MPASMPPAPEGDAPAHALGGRLAVTTARRRKEGLRPRAREVAARLGAPFVERSGLASLQATAGFDWFYIVGHERDEVSSPSGEAFFVQPGLFRSKLAQGRDHPLLRALAPDDDVPGRVLDATLGLAADALHYAAALGCEVIGAEKSPVLQLLLAEGLPRLAGGGAPWSAAAERIRVHAGDAFALLAALPDQSVDVVYFDPMMTRPRRTTPALGSYRAAGLFAPDRPDEEVLCQAARVARARVVIKLEREAPPPPMRVDRDVPGAHVRYAVREG